MNNLELLNELNNFNKSTYNVILIDGPWGSGKTYLINKYIKENQDKLRIFYVSMLGKRNVDDINTSLYGEIHHDASLISIVPSAINPLEGVSSDKSLDFILKLKNDNGDVVIILDDLERYASSDYDEFLSYITNLVLNGAKVICVSNLSELGTGELYNFNLYIEKIFDRVYKAELFNDSILNIKFGKYANLLDKNIVALFNKNYRVVDKVHNFLSEVITKLENAGVMLTNFDYKALIYYVSLIINVYFNNNKKRLEDFKIRPSYEVMQYNKNIFADENDAWEATYVYEYSLNTLYLYKYENDFRFISKLLVAYLYDRFDGLIQFYNEEFKIENISNFDDLLTISSVLAMQEGEGLTKLKALVKDQISSLELIEDYLNVYKKSLTDKERNFYLEIKQEKDSENLAGFINGLTALYKEKRYAEFFTLINENIEFFLNPISEENLNLLKKYKFFLDFDNTQYVQRNRNYILNYSEILKESSFMNDVLEYLKSKEYNLELYRQIVAKFTYIQLGISD